MSARFSSVLIANRGEIACRIMRAARAEGLRVIAVHSDADRDAPHVRLADSSVRIGPSPPAGSYLAIGALLDAARATGAGALHPGYGFLAENADLAEACAAAGLVFVGPPPEAIRAMGDKSAAKAKMEAAGVACAPGYHGADQSPARFAAEARRIGYPVMVKAAAGGGGRGMRIVREPEALAAAIAAAGVEAEAAFGDGRLLVERALLNARHVEVQVFGDEAGHIVHLGERDCSIQRRHQKVIEEAPSPAVSPELRAAMGEAAVRAAAAVGYVGAGTVEFLLDSDGRFWFLEMNTRIQVEHPVTECVTGIDLVRLQFRVAQGGRLPFSQPDVTLRGHAIEARLYAEDSAADFLPSIGTITAWRPPTAEGVRVDAGVEAGSAVTPYYDSMLAKVVACGATREEARRRLVRALEATFVAGVVTNRDFLLHALGRPEFVDGRATTAFVGDAPFKRREASRTALALAAALLVERGRPPQPTAGWRAAPLKIDVDGGERRVSVRRQGAETVVAIDGEEVALRLIDADGGVARYAIDGVAVRAAYARDGEALWLDVEGACRRFADRSYAPPAARDADEGGGAVRAPVSGIVVAVEAKAGDVVKRGQILATVEAMKMHYAILAPIDGAVAEAHAVAGRQTRAQAVLFTLAPQEN
ncbi:geranyl-CoA carboxylase alpha subunit [Roseiarcus fermentans]|uniref:Geranyl-CoA carboxylase alpha subunit n=1 Tax=Roseiarcus fermentans TaxID=1473586 RepID=A0A366EME3_9HYPH|nr:biotin carboxylase N-terminal domain-containing protein [Roseiarcus fermentans]RBP02880.1 geranyl-CoA carboxylase alpha subunit [Roseiarcus fermentans]